MIAIITVEQKDSLMGKEFALDRFFNPIQDLNNNWVISVEEINQCVNPDFLWVKELELTEYLPKPVINPF